MKKQITVVCNNTKYLKQSKQVSGLQDYKQRVSALSIHFSSRNVASISWSYFTHFDQNLFKKKIPNPKTKINIVQNPTNCLFKGKLSAYKYKVNDVDGRE